MNPPQTAAALKRNPAAPPAARPPAAPIPLSPARPVALGRKAVYQDVLDAPPHKVAEIIDGELYAQPRPAMPHALAGGTLYLKVGNSFSHGHGPGGPGGWWIVYEPELHLGDDVIVPDLAGWRQARMPQYPVTAHIKLAPDWACEVLSPSTRKLDLTKKRRIYAREGVKWLWFVDPDSRTLEALELRDGRWAQIAVLTDDDAVSLPPFEAAKFSLALLWGEDAAAVR